MARNKVVSKTRRANNEGSIFQRKDGRWTGAVTTGYDDNGKPIRKFIYGKSRMEVANKLTELKVKILIMLTKTQLEVWWQNGF